VLSPDRSRIAYFSTVRNRTNRYSEPFLTGVWIVGTRANPQHLIATIHAGGPGALAWSPDGRALAYAAGRRVVIWRGSGTGERTVFPIPSGLAVGPALTWSPGGHQIAVPLAPVSPQQAPRTLTVLIAGIQPHSSWSWMSHVRFPPRLLGSRTTAAGSHPDASQIGWTAGGQSLLIATTDNGAGNSLTGVWEVSTGGGMAHLVIGDRGDFDIPPRPDPALSSTTHFLLSPDRRHIATDPDRRFWVAAADGKGGRFVAPHNAVGCAIAQYAWLAGSTGLAYISLCQVQGTVGVRSTLAILPLATGRSRPAITQTSPEANAIGQSVLSLAPAFRCIACG
jgi:dipeptidyl aminopeptidase/acylaminoacyl peptidase